MKTLKVYFATESGNSEGIANEIHREGTKKGYLVSSHDFNTFLKEKVSPEAFYVFIISTFGDGDPPTDSAASFRKIGRIARNFKKLDSGSKDSSESEYSQLKYAVLGLGDTNYSRFCNSSKTLIKHFETLKATSFYEAGFADDGTGMEQVVEPWVENLWSAIEKQSSGNSDGSAEPKPGNSISEIQDSKQSITSDVPETVEQLKTLSVNEVTTDEKEKVDLSSFYWNTFRTLKNTTNRKLNLDFSSFVNISKLQGVPKPIPSNLKLVKPKNCNIDSKSFADNLDLNKDVDFPSKMRYPQWLFTTNNNEGKFEYDSTLVDRVFLAKVAKVQSLTYKGASKRTLLFELDISPEIQTKQENSQSHVGLIGNEQAMNEWEAGDSFGILAPNDPNVVSAILNRVKVEKEKWHVPISLVGDAGGVGHHLKPFVVSLAEHENVQESTNEDPIVKENTDNSESGNSSLNSLFPTLFELFTYKIDITSCPKKQVLRVLSDYCSDPKEKTQLLILSSRSGTALYNTLRSESMMASILDVLNTFPSCDVPVETLLDILPPLTARPFSIASTPLSKTNMWRFGFNVVEHKLDGINELPDLQKEVKHDDDQGSTQLETVRYGVCTSFLDSIVGHPKHLENSPDSILPKFVLSDTLKLNSALKYVRELTPNELETNKDDKHGKNTIYIPVYYRQEMGKFRLAKLGDSETENHVENSVNGIEASPESTVSGKGKPSILISAGTGVTPFMGFIEQRLFEMVTKNITNPGLELYFGCRSYEKDFLFRKELEFYRNEGVLTQLKVSFSRENPSSVKQTMFLDGTGGNNTQQHAEIKYVQDILKQEPKSNEISGTIKKILYSDATVYVCGDALGMGKDVHSVLAGLLVQASAIEHHKQKILELVPADHPGFKDVNENKPISLVQANLILNIWAEIGKYKRDLW
ncbi:hypothetical protein BB560_000823 [Smittium megazygosporum]|uniref:Methionine synthase reductase n=1 Tax=Smittium megazygosporum TaxID=133381 RepID=A0A2T9ZJH0_9FUNG|nr:hypothetical protein BB560_000823 [Smittium megazygosporum]